MNETNRAFSVGDLVQLNSGGFEFTVGSVVNDQVTVNWCEGKKLRTKSFHASMLQRPPSSKSSELEVARRIAFVLAKAARETPGYSASKHSSIDGMIEHILSKKVAIDDHQN